MSVDERFAGSRVASPEAVDEITALIDERRVRSLFQPIVDIESRSIVAYEALARGPRGGPLESPQALFEAAAAAGSSLELDWTCIEAALLGAVLADLHPDVALFINVEARTLGETPPESLMEVIADVRGRLQVVVEITERSVAARPAELLELVENVRSFGWGLAMDDVGVEPGSLALLPFVRPDVIKLDMDLVRAGNGPECAAVIAAVMSHAEETGALILAEGIENEDHLRRAIGMGATLGQGWLFGRPGPLSVTRAPSSRGQLLRRRDNASQLGHHDIDWADTTPFSVVSARRESRIGTMELLLDISNHIEQQALNIPEHPIIVGAFQYAERFTIGTRRRYERLARHCSLAVALGIGFDAREVKGVRGAPLREDDALIDEWSVAVVGPHNAVALVARDLHNGKAGNARRFEFVVTHDRQLVITAMHSLLARVTHL